MESLTIYDKLDFNPLDYIEEFVPPLEESDRPVLFCDLSTIVRQLETWQKQMPRIRPYYAVKSNNEPLILKLLARLGTGFDCASKNEIESVLRLGVSPDRIVFANTVKYVSYLKYAKENSVNLMTFDRLGELEKIKKYHAGANLLLRIAVIPEKFVLGSGEKFGCDVDLEGPELLQAAKNWNLNIVGIAFHIGSGPEIKDYVKAVEDSAKLFKLGQSMGFDMKILDIGGGIMPILSSDLLPYSKALNETINKHFPDLKIEIISEPGRYLTGSSGHLFTTVQCKKTIKVSEEIKIEYFINDGILNTLKFWSWFYGELYIGTVRRSSDLSGDKKYSTVIYGPTNYSQDIIAKEIKLRELEIGDLICFQNTGAYCTSSKTIFNGFDGATDKFFIQRDHLELLK